MTVNTQPKPECYLCGSEGTYLYLNISDQLLNAPGEWNLKKCNNPDCGLAWLDPMPVKEDIGKLYSGYYTQSLNPKHQLNKANAKKIKYLFKVLLSLIPTLDRQKVMSDYMYLQEVKPGKLLDIGCGNGYFLQQMRSRGWDVVGIDFDEKAVEVVKSIGIEAYVGDLSELTFEDNSFDAITLNNVIEHLYDPLECLQKARNLLRDGGQLTVITPNIESLGHQHFKQYWRGLETPRHLFLFSPKTLTNIAQKAGFKHIKSFTGLKLKELIKPGILNESAKIEAKNQPDNLRITKKSQINKIIFQNFISHLSNKNQGEFAVLLAQK